MASSLKGQRPILVHTTAGMSVVPPAELLENLPILHQILDLVVMDWHLAVKPYELRLLEGKQSPLYVAGTALIDLPPVLLKCLFSYVFFFVAAERAYGVLYASLNRANRWLGVKHGKPPGHTPLSRKARMIRDWSIAHFPSEQARRIDSYAAMSWTPMILSQPAEGELNLRGLTFGGFRLRHTDETGRTVESSDLEIQGLDELHKECFAYLETYDRVCTEFLISLREASEEAQ